jgi:hypothetical protein
MEINIYCEVHIYILFHIFNALDALVIYDYK